MSAVSRTDAAIAMQAQGRTNREIAQALGVSVSTAAALLASGHRAKKRGGAGHPASAGLARGRYGMGTTQLETAIMDLWEAKQSKQAIAEALDVRVETVEKIVSYMREGQTDLAFGAKAAALSSSALLAALRRHHPERCGA